MIARRSFLKKGGLAGVLAIFGWGIGEEAARASSPHKWAMIIDLNRCCGCQSCVIACKAQNKTASGEFLTNVLSFEEGVYPKANNLFVPVQCNQCEDAPCVKACPEKATYQLANGIVVTDWNVCTGEGDCIAACPYGARFLDPRFNNRSDKCDFCLNRLEQGLQPACVEACSENARLFGDLNDPEGELKTYLERKDLVHRKPGLNIASRIWYVPIASGKGGGLS